MELRDNPIIRGVLGESTFEKYYEGKKKEWNDKIFNKIEEVIKY